MDESSWDYDAPMFVDFEQGEHKDDEGVDDYFGTGTDQSARLSSEYVGTHDDEGMTSNNRQTFDTPKHIRSAFASLQVPIDASTTASPQCVTIIKDGIQLPVINNNCDDTAVEKSGIPVAQSLNSAPDLLPSPKLEMPADSLDEASDAMPAEESCDEMQDMMESAEPVKEIKLLSSEMPVDSLDEASDVGGMPAESCDKLQDTKMESAELVQEIKLLSSEMAVDSLQEGSDAGVTSAESCNEMQNKMESTEPVKEIKLILSEMAVDSLDDEESDGGGIITESNMEAVNESQQNAETTPRLKDSTTEPESTNRLIDDASTKLEASKPKAPIHSNLITPSRLVAWEKSRKRRSALPSSSNPKGSSEQRRKSLRLAKLKEARSSKPIGSASKDSQPPAKKRKSNITLSVPRTPTVLKHQRHLTGPRVKSREEREREEIDIAKFMQKERKKLSSKSFRSAMKAPAPRPETPSKTTKVKEFKFATDKRIKSTHLMETRSEKLPSEKNFASGLRQHPQSPKKLEQTIVKPFKFSENRKRKLDLISTKDTFKPLEKAVTNFSKKNPFRKPQNDNGTKGPVKAKLPMLTVSKTPKLESKSRTRAVSVISAKEKEEQELEEIKQHQFKAKPANQKILQQPDALPHVEKQNKTVFEEFNLHMEKRIEERPKQGKSLSPNREFKARPIPKAVFEGPKPLIKTAQPKTVPQSPDFKLKNRIEIAQTRRENKENMEKIKEKNEPKPTKPAVQQKKVEVPIKKPNVKVQPFSFAERDAQRMAEKEKRIQEIHDNAKAVANSFKATPMLYDCMMPVPPKQSKGITKAEPFNLASQERGALRHKQWKDDLERHAQTLRDRANFKANTSYTKSLYGEGFKPIATHKQTEFEEFSLHTNTRASKRHEFDERQKQVAAEIREIEEKKEEEAKLLEEEEIRKARKLAEHRAFPIRRYKNVEIQPSNAPLTAAQSPNFSDRFYKKNISE